MNLITDAWMWVVRKDGSRQKISPIQITSKYKENPVIRVDFPRPDFSAMGTQFLISLMQTYFADLEWRRLLTSPLSKKALLEAFEMDRFCLDGKGYRFMQDLDKNELVKTFKVQTLFFESPGVITIKEGRDFFKPDGTISTICPSCAAIALYGKQVNNTEKGQGWNTSIRSCNKMAPLNTIVVGDTLWETLIFNTLDFRSLEMLGGDVNGEKFPWLERTVDSSGKDDNKEMVSLEEKHPCYPLWEMPCRYHLEFETSEDACDVCGDHDTTMVKTIKGKNYGNKYIDPHHTLSPFFETEKGIMFWGPSTLVSNMDYVTFMDCLINNEEKKKYRAPVVDVFMRRGIPGKKLWMFGYLINQAKYFGWMEKTWVIPDVKGKEDTIIELISMATKVGFTVESNVKRMLMTHSDSKDKKKNFSQVREDFYKNTEKAFYSAIVNPDLSMWLNILVMKAFEVFDKYVGLSKIGLQIYMKEAFVEKMNKEIAKKMDLPLLDSGILVKRPAFKQPKFERCFTKEAHSLIMSWWKKQEINRENHALYSKCASVDEILALESFQPFINDFMTLIKPNGASLEAIRDRMAAGVMILSRISQGRVSLSEPFPVQLARVNSRHANDLFRVKDSLRDWKTFERVLDMMPSINVLGFLEGFVNWSRDTKKYWERVYRIANK